MNDKELADKVVALGAGYRLKSDGNQYCVFANCDWCDTVPSSELVRDWRVAGALMEKFVNEELLDMLGNRPAITIDDQVNPRDIIETCVEALAGDQTDHRQEET